jgi:hypothetical protein
MLNLTGTLTYQRSDGLILDLNDQVNIKLRHHDGLAMPDIQHASSGSPGLDGDYWFGVHYPTRVITFDLILMAPNLAALQTLRRRVISALNPTVYSGTLKITQANGLEYWFDCVLAERLEMPTTNHIGQHAMMLTVRFRSVREPFFYEPLLQQLPVGTGSTGGIGNFMVSGFQYPFVLSQSGIFNGFQLVYYGDVPTPIEIVLNGPGIEPVLTNETLGRSVGFVGSGLNVAAGSVLNVNMDPRNRDIRYQGFNGWPYLRESGFWWLQPGPNNLSFQISGSSANTLLTMKWRNRYLGL